MIDSRLVRSVTICLVALMLIQAFGLDAKKGPHKDSASGPSKSPSTTSSPTAGKPGASTTSAKPGSASTGKPNSTTTGKPGVSTTAAPKAKSSTSSSPTNKDDPTEAELDEADQKYLKSYKKQTAILNKLINAMQELLKSLAETEGFLNLKRAREFMDLVSKISSASQGALKNQSEDSNWIRTTKTRAPVAKTSPYGYVSLGMD